MTHKIEDVLDYGYIIAADENGSLVTWNGNATFNFWIYQTGIKSIEGYINTDVRTVYGIESLNAAEKVAQDYLANPDGWEVCQPCRRPTAPDEWDTAERLCVDCVESDKEGNE